MVRALTAGNKLGVHERRQLILSAIVTKTTGQKLADYLRPRILEPIGIRDFQWDVSPEGGHARWKWLELVDCGLTEARHLVRAEGSLAREAGTVCEMGCRRFQKAGARRSLWLSVVDRTRQRVLCTGTVLSALHRFPGA